MQRLLLLVEKGNYSERRAVTGLHLAAPRAGMMPASKLPAMMMIDCISRLVPGVLNNNVSAEFETFHDNLLEYPQYTRPEVFMGKKVPDILLSGHHANVEKWRREQSIIRTLKNRPELLEDAVLSKKEQKFLDELLRQQETEKP